MRQMGWCVIAVWLLSCAVVTHQRASVFQNNLTLWIDARQVAPLKVRPVVNLGWAVYDEGDQAHAAALFAYAMRLSENPSRPFRERAEGRSIAQLSLAHLAGNRRDRISQCLWVASAIRDAPKLLIARQVSSALGC